jgi:hypothetical protein
MAIRRFNWQMWTGFLLSLVAFISYFAVFVWFPVTRDFPWANLLLFAAAAVFLLTGVRRAFARDLPHPKRSKITGTVVATFGVAIFGLFIVSTFIMGRQLPGSQGAPQLGQKAPEFTLSDIHDKQVSLSGMLASPVSDKPASPNPRGVLLVFYRGYW